VRAQERAKAAADKAAAAAGGGAGAAGGGAGGAGAPAAAAAGAGAVSEVARAWKQYTSPDGRPYYYNKITKESKWVQPEEMKAAQAAAAAAGGGGGGGDGGSKTQVVPLAANGVPAKVSESFRGGGGARHASVLVWRPLCAAFVHGLYPHLSPLPPPAALKSAATPATTHARRRPSPAPRPRGPRPWCTPRL
jgi:hypothetical protein